MRKRGRDAGDVVPTAYRRNSAAIGARDDSSKSAGPFARSESANPASG